MYINPYNYLKTRNANADRTETDETKKKRNI